MNLSPEPEPSPTPGPVTQQPRLWFPLALALAAGVAAFVFTMSSALQSHHLATLPYSHHGIARELQRQVQEYIADTGRTPADLAEVIAYRIAHEPPTPGARPTPNPPVVEAPQDFWGTPYQLVIEDGRVDVISFGADGQPGGEGINRDVHAAAELDIRQHALTMSDLMRADGFGGAVWISAVTMLVVMALTFVATTKCSSLPPWGRPVAMIVAALVIFVLSSMIGAFHIVTQQSGH